MNRRGTENIYIINEIIEDAKKNNKEIFCAFLDIEKAYDTVDREILWEILKRIGLSEHIRKIVKSMYRDTVTTYNWNGIEIEGVKTERGLRQGCTLSPLLFTLIMEEFTQRIKNKEIGIKIGNEILSLLLFADDVVVMAENKEELQELLDEAGNFSKDMQMNFGIDKCKIMIINRRQKETDEIGCTLMGRELEVVEEFKYLGIKISKNGLENEKK